MADVAEFSSLVGGIYDAALDPGLWPDVVARMTRFIGGFSACLSIRDRAAGIAHVTPHGDAPDMHYGRLYMEEYYRYDPRDWSLFDVGAVKGTDAFIGREDLAKSRFYREWLAPQEVGDNPICVLDRSPTGSAAFGVFLPRCESHVHEQAFERMRLLTPHLRRAALVTRSLEVRRAEGDSLAEALDGLAAGVILVDGQRRVVHANASGKAMLARKGPLQAGNGRLSARAAAAQRALQRSVAGAADAGCAAVRPGATLVLDAGEDSAPCLAHILPLARRPGAGTRPAHGAVAALFVHDAAPAAPTAAALIAAHYRLTPGEVRVLMAIVEIGGVRETAETLGIAETTVKTHLQRLFAKTGSRRQADLVRLVAGFASPLRR